ncbi:MAG: flagellar export protein FliJ [Firmicutes bacterium]|nr:flagellar export protein FliJ [Bacillota bacterium]
MRKFTFTLESVLQVKYRLEERVRAELADTQSRLVEAQQALRRLSQEKGRHQKEMVRIQQGALDIGSLLLAQDYLAQLNRRIQDQQEVIAQIEAELDRKREELVEAQRERKSLEILKDKQWQEYQKAVQREEQLFLDEVAAIRYGRLGSDNQ